MIKDNRVWIANSMTGNEPLTFSSKMANRHGLVAGATGTGKTVTLKVLAESFSDMGVPVFLADVKGDLAGICKAGSESEDMQARIGRFGLADCFNFQGYPAVIWDIFGKQGIPLRTTISEIGPLLLSRILGLNDLQRDILTIVFKIADDQGLLLIDTKDLKAMLNYVQENSSDLEAEYGKIRSASIGTIMRALVGLELDGGETFFGEPALNINDWLALDSSGKGTIHILDSSSLINNGRLYSTFLLWLMSELFETLPEIGDPDKPKMVFFFDEAHLLFNDASRELLEKIEQVVKLIRSKGVGIYFCTQNPRDIPDGVSAQLGNKVQHALHAYTPAEQKSVRAAAAAFRENPDFDTYEAINALGIGEAIVSFLGDDGIPTIAQKAFILPPRSRFGSLTEEERDQTIKASLLYSKYYNPQDPDSAYEFLLRKGLEAEAEAARRKQEEEAAREAEAAEKARAKEEAAQQKREESEKRKEEAAQQRKEEAERKKAEREKEREERKKRTEAKKVGKSVLGTVGREVGKNFGKKFGSLGSKVGGNLGATLGRGILETLFKS